MKAFVVTQQATLGDLQRFMGATGEKAKLRGRVDKKTGDIVLYTSTKGSGTGFKNIFGKVDRRRDLARAVILKVLGQPLNAKNFQPEVQAVLDSLWSKNGMNKELRAADIRSPLVNPLLVLLANLPTGAKLDADGNLSGVQKQYKMPKGDSRFTPYFGHSLDDVLNQEKNQALGRPAGVQPLNGLKVAKQAMSDLFRFDYTIIRPGQSQFRSMDIKTKVEHDRNLEVAQALRNFTGNDNATLVLSSVLSQTTLIPMPSFIANADGEFWDSIEWTSSRRNVGKDMTILAGDGSKRSIPPDHMGGSKWTIDRDGSDFKISIDWQTYGEAKRGKENLLPLHENGVIGACFKTEIIVNGQEAEKGKVALIIPGGINVEFSGRLSLEQNQSSTPQG